MKYAEHCSVYACIGVIYCIILCNNNIYIPIKYKLFVIGIMTKLVTVVLAYLQLTLSWETEFFYTTLQNKL